MRAAAPMVVLALIVGGCVSGSDQDPRTTSSTTSTAPSSMGVATPTGPSPASGAFKLEPFAAGLEEPVYVTHAGDGSGRVFIVEQAGRIRIVRDGVLLPEPFLDLTTIVESAANERGLLSVAFYPDYETSGRFIVDYTRKSSVANDVGDSVIARYKVSSNPDLADPSSAEVLMVVDQPEANHNGGLVKFGPDGMLYAAFGDGGFRDDCCPPGHAPEGNAQNLQTMLGKLLRIDVSAEGAYKVPADNPDLGSNTKKEIWAYGLRNPWRFSFDRATGDMFIGDVGQDFWEEVDYQPRSSKGGENYGWPVWEGTHLYKPGAAVVGNVPPVAEYSISGAASECSVTGGYVYRGTKIAGLAGYYVVGDYCSGQLWTLARVNNAWSFAQLIDTQFSISSFGEDEEGELYLVHHRGSVQKFVPVGV